MYRKFVKAVEDEEDAHEISDVMDEVEVVKEEKDGVVADPAETVEAMVTADKVVENVEDSVAPRSSVTVSRYAILGLEGAGKRSLLAGLAYDLDEDNVEIRHLGEGVSEVYVEKGTVCFLVGHVKKRRMRRTPWRKYLRNIQGLIYVVDSADQGRIMEARLCLHTLIRLPCLANVPVAVLANKQDVSGAFSPHLVNVFLCLRRFSPTRNRYTVLPTVAIDGTGLRAFCVDFSILLRIQKLQTQMAVAEPQGRTTKYKKKRSISRCRFLFRLYRHIESLVS